jgi:hypothetical protein
MTAGAEGNQVQIVIRALLATQLLVMDLQILCGTTCLAFPAVTPEHLLPAAFRRSPWQNVTGYRDPVGEVEKPHGHWFESPVNLYGKQRVWDMNPKSLDVQEMPLTLKIDSSCLHCHASAVQPVLPGASNQSFVSAHHRHEPDCTSCHMPREQTRDVAHEQLTDHRIQRPFVVWPVAAQPDDLMAIGGAVVSDRDIGLAYFQFAQHGDQKAGQRALSLLKRAERSNQEQPDADLHTALGFLEQLSGDTQDSRSEYRAALRADPASSVAAGNLAILEAREGNTKNAAALLRLVSENDPAETAAGVDLAMIECSAGDPQAAVKTLGICSNFLPITQKRSRFWQPSKTRACPAGRRSGAPQKFYPCSQDDGNAEFEFFSFFPG